MLLRSFAHRVFIALVVLTFLVLLLVGVSLGWWGRSLQNGFSELIDSFLVFYTVNETAFDVLFRAFGVAATVLTGLFGLHKALYFAERNLPKRLEDYIQNIQNKLVVAERDVVLAEVGSSPGIAIAKLEANKPEVERVLGVLSKAEASWDYQQATLHYVYGRQSVFQAQNEPTNPFTRSRASKNREEAINHYKQAALLDPSDLRALKFAAEQAEVLQHHDLAQEFWNALAKAHHQRRETFQEAQALYGVGKSYFERSRDGAARRGEKYEFWAKARDALGNASELLRTRSDGDWCALLAECCELLGRVRTKLRTLPSARAAFDEAVLLYNRLNRFDDARRVENFAEEVKLVRTSTGIEIEEPSDPEYAIARAYENLGAAHIRRDELPSSRSKAEKNLRLALACYEQIEPKPLDEIARVEQLLNDPWLE